MASIDLRSTTGTTSSVSSSATSVTILAANSNRVGWSVWNESTQILYIKCGATATTSDYTVQVAASAYFEQAFGYVGRVDGLWASANGSARVTEFI